MEPDETPDGTGRRDAAFGIQGREVHRNEQHANRPLLKDELSVA
jgi:hypothetical protein